MRRLRKYLSRPPAERLLLLQALALVFAVRLGLWLLPFRVLDRGMSRYAIRFHPHARRHQVTPDNVSRAVVSAARFCPRATCLTQALAARALILHYGHDATLRLGVARGSDGRFLAHAWLESAGKIVIGGGGRELYTALPALHA